MGWVEGKIIDTHEIPRLDAQIPAGDLLKDGLTCQKARQIGKQIAVEHQFPASSQHHEQRLQKPKQLAEQRFVVHLLLDEAER